jgi:hypothetical protein
MQFAALIMQRGAGFFLKKNQVISAGNQHSAIKQKQSGILTSSLCCFV